MADVKKMIEQREKLEKKIKEEIRKEHEKFGRWFFNKMNLKSSAEAKKFINENLFNNKEEKDYDNTKESNYYTSNNDEAVTSNTYNNNDDN